MDANTVIDDVAKGATMAEAMIPAVAPFSPLIALVLGIAKAHYNVTQAWPTEQQVMAALPADYQNLQTIWSQWSASKAVSGATAPAQ